MPIQHARLKHNDLYVSLEVLDLLDAGLKRLRQFNGQFHPPSDKPNSNKDSTLFWFSELNDWNTNDVIVNDDATIKQYQSTVKRYKMAQAALSGMSSSLEERLGKMIRVMRSSALAHGISKIPDEILAHIFECIYEPWSTDSSFRPKPEDLRLVCKRFRQVVDSRSSLRRYFTSKMTLKEVEYRLDRCGQVGLRVKIFDHRKDRRDGHNIIATFADALTPHAHRWEELQFFHITRFNTTQAVKQAFNKFKALNLPRLQRLVLWSRDWSATHDIYSTWTMPNLRRIKIHNGVPMELPGTANLSQCDVVLNDHDLPGFVPEFFEFLGSCTSLTTLRVTHDKATFMGSYYDRLDPVHLPNLRTFHAYVRFGSIINDCDDMSEVSERGQAIFNLIEHFNAPKLEQFSVELDSGPLWRRWTSGVLDYFLYAHGKSSSLQTFALRQVRHRIDDDVESIVNNPCNGNIILSGLDLGCRKAHLQIPNPQEGTYCLRTLTLKNCRLSIRGVKALLKLYTTKELYPNFEGIILEQCDGVNRESLLGVTHSNYVYFVK